MDRNSNYSQTWLHQTAWENLFIKPQFVIITEFVNVVNIDFDFGPKNGKYLFDITRSLL